MSTWYIRSDNANNYRWELSGVYSGTELKLEPNEAPIERRVPTSSLPSMSDLLLQNRRSRLLENGNASMDSSPMFRSGLGNPVALKQSSVAKALSILGDDEDDDSRDTRKQTYCQNEEAFLALGRVPVRDCRPSNSRFLFQTGSGKMVNVSSTGLERAKTLLGLDEGNAGLYHSRKITTTSDVNSFQPSSNLDRREGSAFIDALNPFSAASSSITGETILFETKLNDLGNPVVMEPKMHGLPSTSAPVKFQTAGGRSISISGDALKRAKSLLGDPELGDFLNEGKFESRSFSSSHDRNVSNDSPYKDNGPLNSFLYQETPKRKDVSKEFISPLRSSSSEVNLVKASEKIMHGANLISKFDAAACDSFHGSNHGLACLNEPQTIGSHASIPVIVDSTAKGIGGRTKDNARFSSRPLRDISNRVNTASSIISKGEMRRLAKTSSISPFKRPRSSKFLTPLKRDHSFASSGLSTSLSEHSPSKRKVSSRYPFQASRAYVSEYLRGPPLEHDMHIPDQVRRIRSENADEFMFSDESGLSCVGAEAFFHKLVQFGACAQRISKEWVRNHYRWIVWKLACYERWYPAASGKFLTITSVLEELKYRYEREINHGHRSAIKRILEGNASPAMMLVLCVSAVNLQENQKTGNSTLSLNGSGNDNAAILELTDGWYHVNAFLDDPLSKLLIEKKVFVGQKIRIWGAKLCGWARPVSPLQGTRNVNLLLHANGTYRAHWADRLGFCKSAGDPLAFRCIKSNGGPVPMTLVGVTRIYPILYKERLSSGVSIVRSERMEIKTRQLYSHRRTLVIDSVISEFQKSAKDFHLHDCDSEGAKILKLLELSAEPEVLMAEMSPERLSSFAAYQSKLEATRQSKMDKLIGKALQDAGLAEREVTPFMRVRVVGLQSKKYQGKSSHEEGFITIWNPTEKQQGDVVEGKAYALSGLVPVDSNTDTIYLQARGSTTKWRLLSSKEVGNFKPFFNPRKAIYLSNLGQVPLSSEFDIAAFVLYVGEVYMAGHQKRQWVFVTDGSVVEMETGTFDNSLLAISFCFPYIDDDSFVPVNVNLTGSTVGFCNLIKQAKDGMNHLWVAEATENSNYFLTFDPPYCRHLKNAAVATQGWAKISETIINRLRERVLLIVGDCES